jgi:succinoglycan biosynthesis transport protein ExoP
MSEMSPDDRQEYQAGATIDVQAAVAPKFRLQKFLTFLLKYWWVPTTIVIVSLGAAVLYILHQPPTFVSRGSMWETVKLHLPDETLFSEDVANFLGTQSELLQSAKLRELTLARLRAASNDVAIPVDENGDPLAVKVTVSQASKSVVFALEATGSQASYTRAYLNALMDAYMEYKKDVRKEVSGDTLASITAQVGLAERELKSRQDLLTEFERSNNLAILQTEGTVAGGHLTTLKTELSDLQLDYQIAAATSNEFAGMTSSANLLATATNLSAIATNLQVSETNQTNSTLPAFAPQTAFGGAASAERQSTSRELELLKDQRAKLSQYLRPMHPDIKKLDDDIERDEKALELYRRENREQSAASRQNTRLRLENVRASIREWETNVSEASIRIAEAERLKRNVERAQSDYDRLAMLVQNVKISREIDQETLTILEHASPAKRSYRAEKGSLESALVAGLLLGLGFIALLTVRDEKFSSVLEVNEKLGDAVIAQVPELPGLNGKLPSPEENANDWHIYAESYRCLRSALLFLPVDAERPKVLLITSALPDEGKSTVAANLARTLAMGGARVLLVDGDMRRGALHQLLGLSNGPGLAHLLNKPAEADKALQINSIPNLWFISSGTRLSNPGDLFLGANLDDLLRRWRAQFDYVLIDSSPIFAADDATTLAPKVDGTMLVVRSRFSSARQVRAALEMLQQRQARVLGVVFNRVDASTRSYGYYNYSKYYPGPDALTAKSG